MGLLLFFAPGPAQIREDEKLVRGLLTIGNAHTDRSVGHRWG
jgi:hypothetical protein